MSPVFDAGDATRVTIQIRPYYNGAYKAPPDGDNSIRVLNADPAEVRAIILAALKAKYGENV